MTIETEHQIHVVTIVASAASSSVHTCVMTGYTKDAAKNAASALSVGQENTRGTRYVRATVHDTGRPFTDESPKWGL